MKPSPGPRSRSELRQPRRAAAFAAPLLGLAVWLASVDVSAAVIPLAGRYAEEVRSVPIAGAEQARRPASAATREASTPPGRQAPAPVNGPASLRTR